MDQLKQGHDCSSPTPSRRDFIALAASLACAAALCPAAQVFGDGAAGPIDVGTPADFTADGITDKWGQADGFIIVRKNGELYALTAHCTHKGGSVRLDAADPSLLKCPKHGALYNMDGTVKKGPAKQPLERVAISKNDKGHVIVDPSKSVVAGADGFSVKA